MTSRAECVFQAVRQAVCVFEKTDCDREVEEAVLKEKGGREFVFRLEEQRIGYR